MNAMLGLLPAGVPVHRLDGSREQMLRLKLEASGGFLVAAEISQAPVPDYIWGEPVRELFETLAAGYSLASALHAPDVPGTFDVLCRENGVGDEAASRLGLVLHLLRFGDDPDSFWRRLAEVSEIHGCREASRTPAFYSAGRSETTLSKMSSQPACLRSTPAS